MLSQEQNEKLTRVGPSTPMGELLRRYWHPVSTSQALRANPVISVTLLGEMLTLFRAQDGSLGLVGQRCLHRGVDLKHGIPEREGIRCPYHGWLYDATGQCLEQPPEDPESSYPSKIKLESYPVRELGGLIWAYLGPLPQPELPGWELFDQPNVFRQIGLTDIPCNWLQCQENSMDTVHTEYVHGRFGEYALERSGVTEAVAWEMAERMKRRHVDIRFEDLPYGIQKYRLREGQDRSSAPSWNTGHPLIFPNMVLIGASGRREMQIRVPVDDTRTWHISYQVFIPREGVSLPSQDPVPTFALPIDGIYPIHVMGQDGLVWPAQGDIADRTKEHLTPTDRGIIMFRRLLNAQIDVAVGGDDPMNVFRDAEEVGRIVLKQERAAPIKESQFDATKLAAADSPVLDRFADIAAPG